MNFFSLRPFGIELESNPVIPGKELFKVISENATRSVIKTNWKQTHSNKYWHLKTDSTCGGGSAKGWEIASFKASGNKDLEEILNVTKALRNSGVKCGKDCGFHVHVDISDFSPEQAGVLLAHWIKIEKILLRAVPNHRVNNKYCKIICSKIINKKKKYEPLIFWNCYKPKNLSVHNNKDKKVTMNLVNYATCLFYEENKIDNDCFCDRSRKTVEFRFPEGTFNEKVVKNWIIFFVNFVDGVSKKSMPQDLLLAKSLSEFLNISSLNLNTKVKKWLFYRICKFDRGHKWKKIAKKEVNMA